MKNIVCFTQDTFDELKGILNTQTIELGEQTLRVLNSISWQLKRCADAWEGSTVEKEVEEKSEKPKPKNIGKARNASQPQWTPEEDEMLMNLVEVIGPRWSLIYKTKKLPGRTPGAIGSRYFYLSRNQETLRKIGN